MLILYCELISNGALERLVEGSNNQAEVGMQEEPSSDLRPFALGKIDCLVSSGYDRGRSLTLADGSIVISRVFRMPGMQSRKSIDHLQRVPCHVHI